MENNIGRIAHARTEDRTMGHGAVIEVDKDLARFKADDMIVVTLADAKELTLHVEEPGNSTIKVGGKVMRDQYWVFSLINLGEHRWTVQLEPQHIEMMTA